MDFSAFAADRKTVYAVVRALEIVSEASRRPPPELKARHLTRRELNALHEVVKAELERWPVS